MNIFKNKYFLLGNLAFLLLAIPVVLFFVKNQTSTRGSAAPTTTLSFIDPSLTPDQCDATRTSRLVLNPGQNVVANVQLAFKWDKTKFDIEFAPNQTAFPQTMKGPEQTASGMNITLSIGSDVTKAITTTTDVGTITIKPIAPTNGTVVKLEIDPTGTKVWSLSNQEESDNENVYNSAGSSPLQISITPKTCDAAGTPTPTPTLAPGQPTPTPTPTSPPGSTPTPTTASLPTATPTTAAISTPTPTTVTSNQSPVCISLDSTTVSGPAPLSVTLTASGRDTGGTISKITFNFGNGTQQDVTTGLGTASASAQLSHTYTSGGTFTATSVFTDNSGAVSATCSKVITVTGAVATMAPTATSTPAPTGIGATETPTNTPTIAPSGNLGATIGLTLGIILVVIAGIFLLAL